MKHIVLTNGQEFELQEYKETQSPVRVDNELTWVDVVYIETFDQHEPTGEGVSHYHSWTMKTGDILHAWMIPSKFIK